MIRVVGQYDMRKKFACNTCTVCGKIAQVYFLMWYKMVQIGTKYRIGTKHCEKIYTRYRLEQNENFESFRSIDWNKTKIFEN
jgi:hypothetical protein